MNKKEEDLYSLLFIKNLLNYDYPSKEDFIKDILNRESVTDKKFFFLKEKIIIRDLKKLFEFNPDFILEFNKYESRIEKIEDKYFEDNYEFFKNDILNSFKKNINLFLSENEINEQINTILDNFLKYIENGIFKSVNPNFYKTFGKEKVMFILYLLNEDFKKMQEEIDQKKDQISKEYNSIMEYYDFEKILIDIYNKPINKDIAWIFVLNFEANNDFKKKVLEKPISNRIEKSSFCIKHFNDAQKNLVLDFCLNEKATNIKLLIEELKKEELKKEELKKEELKKFEQDKGLQKKDSLFNYSDENIERFLMKDLVFNLENMKLKNKN